MAAEGGQRPLRNLEPEEKYLLVSGRWGNSSEKGSQGHPAGEKSVYSTKVAQQVQIRIHSDSEKKKQHL